MLKLKDLYQGFRDHKSILAWSQKIKQDSKTLDKKIRVMEVCGGHTHSIMKYGINQLLDDVFEFIHGPGCPVCIMPKSRINHAIILAQQENTIIATLGDMIRIPSSMGSLSDARSRGADVRFIYSPLDLLKIAKDHPNKTVIYFAIGFETTTPMSAALLERIQREQIKNILFHINHVLVPPPMEAILQNKEVQIDAFIAPSHVSVITGSKIYEPFTSQYHIPTVVSGFEPVDILEALWMILNQVKRQEAKLENQYKRAVTFEGNTLAQEKIKHYFTVRESFTWRGIGEIPHSALRLKDEFAQYDAEHHFNLPIETISEPKGCICPQIIGGIAKPSACKLFGKACTPSSPIGSCMVSSEGVCNAYFRYGNLISKDVK
ncbi:hydrogenase formation protein HypD [Helicobacter pametensis]|uniref:hydrogenase formation protein HypD n=1 Tax=Helicobacter pametensis TaxID=95149 RepID=UPI0004AF172B|nr:hydrogenase formation protein HypD [Helicobacter pametensis]